jgi:hypothetical protein
VLLLSHLIGSSRLKHIHHFLVGGGSTQGPEFGEMLSKMPDNPSTHFGWLA